VVLPLVVDQLFSSARVAEVQCRTAGNKNAIQCREVPSHRGTRARQPLAVPVMDESQGVEVISCNVVAS
jgi:hypothetical protein